MYKLFSMTSQNFNNCLQDVVFCCVRRSLCYPLYRHWSLIVAVLNDIKTIFKLGKILSTCIFEYIFVHVTIMIVFVV